MKFLRIELPRKNSKTDSFYGLKVETSRNSYALTSSERICLVLLFVCLFFDWLLHLRINEEFDGIVKSNRDLLQNLVNCRFIKSPEMRILKSSKGRLLNMLPIFVKKTLINHLIIQLSHDHT